jgi:hypothetical protein
MWNRTCPLCSVRLSRFQVLTLSNELSCPACHVELELSRPSRLLSSSVGIAVGAVIFHVAQLANPMARWTWPIVAAFLAFGFASAGALIVSADLVVRPRPSHSSAFPHAHA